MAVYPDQAILIVAAIAWIVGYAGSFWRPRWAGRYVGYWRAALFGTAWLGGCVLLGRLPITGYLAWFLFFVLLFVVGFPCLFHWAGLSSETLHREPSSFVRHHFRPILLTWWFAGGALGALHNLSLYEEVGISSMKLLRAFAAALALQPLWWAVFALHLARPGWRGWWIVSLLCLAVFMAMGPLTYYILDNWLELMKELHG